MAYIVYDPNIINGQTPREWLPILQQGLAPHSVAFKDDKNIDSEKVDYLVTWYLQENPLNIYPNLKAVLAMSAGVNHIVGNPYLPQSLPLVRMIDPGLTKAMEEYVLSMVLRLHIGHDFYQELEQEKKWGLEMVDPVLAGERTVGFLGFGELGQACAKRCAETGFRVSGWSRSRKTVKGIKSYAGDEELEAFLKQNDIVVILLPLTKETRNFMDHDKIAMMKKGSCLINVARGPIVVDEALLEHLDNNHIDRAILDVFRKEPLPEDHPYWEHCKVTVTPHIAALTHPKTAVKHLKEVVESIQAGNHPPGLVDMDKGY